MKQGSQIRCSLIPMWEFLVLREPRSLSIRINSSPHCCNKLGSFSAVGLYVAYLSSCRAALDYVSSKDRS